MQEYKEYYQPIQATNFRKTQKAFFPSLQKNYNQKFRREIVECVQKETKNADLRSLIRFTQQELGDEYKLCSIYNRFLSSAKANNNSHYISMYTLLRRTATKNIEHLKEKSIYIAFKLCGNTNFKQLDLHFLYLSEAMYLLQLVIDTIKEKFLTIDNPSYVLEIITGKGTHSQARAVLYPQTQVFLKQKGYKVVLGEGKVTTTIKL